MFYCSNPSCSNPFNPDANKFCISCGSQSLAPLLRNRYRVIRLLGEGGFGKTYEAQDVDRMDDPCVVKQFVPQIQGTAALAKATELFKQEAKRLYELGEHPQIPRLVAYFEQDKRLYLVQEFIEGQNLLQELLQKAFNEQQIKQLLTDILPVLQVVHNSGVIHRDIKPENIMRRRKDGKLMLIDFGVSKQATGTFMGQVGTTVGTQGYTPMEQMRGQVYPASDLYSLGVTCIRLLTQCLPRIDGADDLYDAFNSCWVWRDRLPQGTTINPIIGQVLDKLLQDFVKERYQSADEVLQALNSEQQTEINKVVVAPTVIDPLPPVPSIPLPVMIAQSPPNNEKGVEISVQLISARGINYDNLEQLLTAKQWQEADRETTNRMLEAIGQTKRTYFLDEDIRNLPCEDLRTIDQLWTKYSNGRFGFSVQKRLWRAEGGKLGISDIQVWNKFGDRVGWRVRNKWLYYSDLTFTSNAPEGHLPIIGLGKWEKKLVKWLFEGEALIYDGCVSSIALRMENCKI